jgi:hypothetical protein
MILKISFYYLFCLNRYHLVIQRYFQNHFLKAKDHVWHKSSMKKGVVPHSGIDTEAKW